MKNIKPRPEETAALLRIDLSSFIHRSFLELNPQTEYLHNWHIDLIADALTRVAMGESTRLIINIPPRNLKSMCATIAFVAWALGKWPHKRFICASFGADLAHKHALDCRQIMLSPWYQAVFPTRLNSSKMAVHDFATTEKGGRMAVSTGGGITGRGADILIIDDPLKPDEASSDTTRKGANSWFDNTAYTRLDSKKHGAIVIIMQRLHMDDLVGHVKEKGDWEIINLPAIAEEAQTFHYRSIRGPKTVHRKIGDVLHPERESLETLMQIRDNIGEYPFTGQYQQAPVPLGGGLIKNEWIHSYEPHELPSSFELLVQSWDTASKTNQFSDYSVCVTLGLKNKMIYVLDLWRGRVDFPALKTQAIVKAHQFKPHHILVEDASSGIQLVQELKHQQIYSVKPIRPEKDKITRIFAQTAVFESGRVKFPVEAPWLRDCIHELTTFPFDKFDDQVDALGQGLTFMRDRLDEPGIFGYMRQEVEKLKQQGLI